MKNKPSEHEEGSVHVHRWTKWGLAEATYPPGSLLTLASIRETWNEKCQARRYEKCGIYKVRSMS